ncbi:MAG TPA: nitrite reductase large subunit NirB [Burkholderiales bacterium]|nr:nitrite reductase large subunit NirB [Burkholderiales bacterium]
MSKTRIVCVGNGMVGQRFLEQLAKRLPSDAVDLTVFCEEPRAAYDRVQLTTFFAGRSALDLSVVPERFFEERAITLRLNDRVVAIDRARRIVRSARYREVPYDKLVLATGSYPFVPPIPGRDRRGCFVYRSIEHLEVIRSAARRARVGAVVGGGLLGLEAAKALLDLGLETHVVEFAPRLMAAQLDDAGAQLLRRKIEALGVAVHTSKNTKAVVDGAGHAHRMVFADGTALDTDLIVYSAGIRPHDELARAAGLHVGERGGIVIDDRCRTSDADIYAVGECALWNGRIYGLVAPGYQMAEVAARHLAGERDAAFRGADTSTKLKLMGVDVASIGDALGATAGALDYAYADPVRGVYKKLVVAADGKSLLGGILVGDAADYGTLLQMALNGIALPDRPEDLILPMREGGATKGLGVDLLPATAQICSCNDVTKGALCEAVTGGCTTVAALKTKTKASSTCGGCATLVKQILESELRKCGVEVKNHLCEHFEHSRQALFSLVRFGGLETFDDVLARHGHGRGCDICKPAVASILAACWNEHILEPKHTPLQDTNDRFLANLQKDGSYSVVPRVPGGEITPEKLIVLGRVAQNFGLYTKITGAQRIDMFGARVEQLPLIWQALVDAGFESGHAYGKALRTVKSCVGSTWCRYGVQDSVSMAIALETRYRGLRAPHKLKMAVSGCTRECAEAQGKDVGVIATEKGWNLYVCGNGGMKPRHADLLAKDLDDATLFRYVDRFLMFYIRTADRLQRTSTWLENLEGGVEYVRTVVCEDALGIARELEADMHRLVESYECEWKKAISDPEIRKRFRHFVNSDASDANIVFVSERDQIRPARPEEREKEPA